MSNRERITKVITVEEIPLPKTTDLQECDWKSLRIERHQNYLKFLKRINHLIKLEKRLGVWFAIITALYVIILAIISILFSINSDNLSSPFNVQYLSISIFVIGILWLINIILSHYEGLFQFLKNINWGYLDKSNNKLDIYCYKICFAILYIPTILLFAPLACYYKLMNRTYLINEHVYETYFGEYRTENDDVTFFGTEIEAKLILSIVKKIDPDYDKSDEEFYKGIKKYLNDNKIENEDEIDNKLAMILAGEFIRKSESDEIVKVDGEARLVNKLLKVMNDKNLAKKVKKSLNDKKLKKSSKSNEDLKKLFEDEGLKKLANKFFESSEAKNNKNFKKVANKPLEDEINKDLEKIVDEPLEGKNNQNLNKVVYELLKGEADESLKELAKKLLKDVNDEDLKKVVNELLKCKNDLSLKELAKKLLKDANDEDFKELTKKFFDKDLRDLAKKLLECKNDKNLVKKLLECQNNKDSKKLKIFNKDSEELAEKLLECKIDANLKESFKELEELLKINDSKELAKKLLEGENHKSLEELEEFANKTPNVDLKELIERFFERKTYEDLRNLILKNINDKDLIESVKKLFENKDLDELAKKLLEGKNDEDLNTLLNIETDNKDLNELKELINRFFERKKSKNDEDLKNLVLNSKNDEDLMESAKKFLDGKDNKYLNELAKKFLGDKKDNKNDIDKHLKELANTLLKGKNNEYLKELANKISKDKIKDILTKFSEGKLTGKVKKELKESLINKLSENWKKLAEGPLDTVDENLKIPLAYLLGNQKTWAYLLEARETLTYLLENRKTSLTYLLENPKVSKYILNNCKKQLDLLVNWKKLTNKLLKKLSEDKYFKDLFEIIKASNIKVFNSRRCFKALNYSIAIIISEENAKPKKSEDENVKQYTKYATENDDEALRIILKIMSEKNFKKYLTKGNVKFISFRRTFRYKHSNKIKKSEFLRKVILRQKSSLILKLEPIRLTNKHKNELRCLLCGIDYNRTNYYSDKDV
ncbi:hypothetical protein C2G38_2106176 [Gigaspora rosea]|uniref:Uncharacterized protein n=1 Tax=Gigaspora rosea TaxID=44941 RepID=A0A397UJD8_9GLOM|nr:hypothetical protein C2G38_2106176 [Gigaspora rosea]